MTSSTGERVVDRLAPGRAAPHRQHARLAATCARCRRRRSSPLLAGDGRAAARPDRRRQDRGGRASRCCPRMAARAAGPAPRCSTSARSRHCSTTCTRAWTTLRRLARPARRALARRRQRSRSAGAILRDRPDILLTTPESLEAMLVSVKVDHARVLRRSAGRRRRRGARLRRRRPGLAPARRAGTAGAGSPAGRSSGSACPPPSATPTSCCTWLQGAGAGSARPGRRSGVTAGASAGDAGPPPGDVELDYVGSLDNAATVIAALHRGEKRLVFCDSRQPVEELGAALRARERRRPSCPTPRSPSTSAAAPSRRSPRPATASSSPPRPWNSASTSATSTGSSRSTRPRTVASFLQRLGRTGRRAGTARNCLFLATRRGRPAAGGRAAAAVGHAAGWSRSTARPSRATSSPSRLLAAVPAGAPGRRPAVARVVERPRALRPRRPTPILRHLVEQGYLDSDGGMLFIGPEAERRFGRRHFMDLTAVFTAPPQFTVLRRPHRDRPDRPRRAHRGASRARGCCCSPAAAGRSPTSTGSAGASSSSRPTAAATPSG